MTEQLPLAYSQWCACFASVHHIYIHHCLNAAHRLLPLDSASRSLLRQVRGLQLLSLAGAPLDTSEAWRVQHLQRAYL